MAALTTPKPLTVAYFREPELHRRVRSRLATRRFDVALAFSSSMAQYIEGDFNLPRIMEFVDLDSQKWADYAQWRRPSTRWLYRLEAARLLDYERRIASEFSQSLLSTDLEVADFHRLIPGAPVSCLSNGVDLDHFRPTPYRVRKHTLVFTGQMQYFPNVDGIVWFCRSVLPIIRRRVADVTLTICGAQPVARVRSLARIPGVTVTGSVPDVRPYLGRARVGVVPLRLGRGIQNKLLEAMAMGLPTVATSVAYGGVEARAGRDLLVADEPEAFAEAVVHLLLDDGLQEQMGRAARDAMERNYRWDAALSRLDAVLESVTAADVSGSLGNGRRETEGTPEAMSASLPGTS